MTQGARGPARAEAFVLANSTLRPVPLVPEISLHLADDAFSVWEASERQRNERNASRQNASKQDIELPPPFWAFAWPGGQALAQAHP